MLQAVSVAFNELSLEPHTNCSYDSVSLYDGSSANSSSLGRFCTVSGSRITSSGSFIFVIFQTDAFVNKGRFSLNWKFIDQGGQGWFITFFLIDILAQVNYQPSHSYLGRTSLIWMTQITLYVSTEFHPTVSTNSVCMLYGTVLIFIAGIRPTLDMRIASFRPTLGPRSLQH